MMGLCGGDKIEDLRPQIGKASSSGGLDAEGERGGGVAGAEQRPAGGRLDTHAVDLQEGDTGKGVQGIAHVGEDEGLVGLGDGKAKLGGAKQAGQGIDMLREGAGIVGLREHFEETRGGVEGIVVAEVAVGKKQVARDLGGEGSACLVELFAQFGVADAPHDDLATCPGQLVEDGAGAAHFTDKAGAGGGGQDVASKQNEQLVAPDDAALVIDDDKAIGVAIKGKAELDVLGGDGIEQPFEVGGLGGIGGMEGKAAIGDGGQGMHGEAQAGKQGSDEGPGHAVGGIDDEGKAPGAKGEPGDEKVQIRGLKGRGIRGDEPAGTAHKVRAVEEARQGMETRAMGARCAIQELEAVVGGGVVAGGDHRAGVAAEVMGGVIKLGGREHAGVKDGDGRGQKAI